MERKSFIEELLGARWKIRTLKVIVSERQINISALAKISDSFFSSVVKYVEFLKKYNIVKEKKFGKIRIIVANESSDIFNLITKLIDKSEEIEKLKVMNENNLI